MSSMQVHLVGSLIVLVVSSASLARGAAADDNVKWLVAYEGKALPAAPQWTLQGGSTVRSNVIDGALHIADDAKEDFCCFRAAWEADPASEIVVEARVRVAAREGATNYPWTEGSPAHLFVSDGLHQEGLSISPNRISTFLDRFYLMNTTDKFHVYRLVIRGTDMSVCVDGQQKIRGKDAFWKPADGKPFVQFGSNAKAGRGETYWEYVKLGVRPAQAAAKSKLKITVSEPWPVPKFGPFPQTRPYLYNVGEGLLLMSVAQGPDKLYEPYGVLRSEDSGRTWAPVEGLQAKTFAPQPMIRLSDGNILGVSRWSLKYSDYQGKTHCIGMTYLFDRMAKSFSMVENKILLPKDAVPDIAFDRHIFDIGGGVIRAVVYDDGRHDYLLETKDQGKTWTYFSTIGRGDEPSVTRISDKEWTAVIRQNSWVGLHQVWSHDGGKTWSPPTVLEEGSVDADLITMTNGILACSYGRPGSNIMFSTDQGKTWDYHRVISDRGGFNYSAIREVSPGRLLYLHDAPVLSALYVDVQQVAQ
jgi:hypothetical protein